MAFDDNPIVDDNSKLSEDSVYEIRKHFSKKNGFINRESNPDYGVDLQVELILSENQASGQYFPIQIKSSHEINYINHSGENYIPLSIATSRLGYLSRNKPAYGLVVYYDDSTGRAYFEYVEELVKRVDEFKGNRDWRNQDSVTIHFTLQILDKDNLKSIHEKFRIRFENHSKLLSEHGHSYNIPILELPLGNLKEPEDAFTILQKYGGMLFNYQKFGYLFQLIESLEKSQLRDSRMAFLAALTYSQIGYVTDAEYYIKKCLKDNSLPDEEKELVMFGALKTEALKGDINVQQYTARLNKLHQKSTNCFHLLIYKINLQSANLSREQEQLSMLNDILLLTDEIDNSNLEDRLKYILTIFQFENLSTYMMLKISHNIKIIAFSIKMGQEITMAERVELVKETLSINALMHNKTVKIIKHAEKEGDDLLKFMAWALMAQKFVHLQVALFIGHKQFNSPIEEDNQEFFERHLQYALLAHNGFLEVGLIHDAYKTLGNAYEIIILFKNLYGKNLETITLSEVRGPLNHIAEHLDLEEYSSITEDFISRFNTDKKFNAETYFADLSKEEVQKIGQALLETYQLPEDRLVNITNDIDNYRIFHKYVKNTDYELLQDKNHMDSRDTAYKLPCSYIIKNKKLGLESIRSSNVVSLIQGFLGISINE